MIIDPLAPQIKIRFSGDDPGRSGSGADQESIIIDFDHYFYMRHSRDDLGEIAHW